MWVPSGARGSVDWVFAKVQEDVEEGAKQVVVALEDESGGVVTAQDPQTGEYPVLLSQLPPSSRMVLILLCTCCADMLAISPQPKTATYARELVYIRNPDIQDGVDDLTALSYMHDPAILHAVRIFIASECLVHPLKAYASDGPALPSIQLYLRYRVDMIYSYSGPILIAVNPYKEIPGLYSKNMVRTCVRGLG